MYLERKMNETKSEGSVFFFFPEDSFSAKCKIHKDSSKVREHHHYKSQREREEKK